MHAIQQEEIDAENAAAAATRAAGWKKGPDGTDLGVPGNDLLAVVRGLVTVHLWATEHECLAMSLWILHTYVFRQFRRTPRLLFISPIEDSGKTTASKIVGLLAPEAEYCPDITAAAIRTKLDDNRGMTLALDEVDNFDLAKDVNMRKIFNNGFESHGAKVSKIIGGRLQEFDVSAPLSFGTLQELPRPLMSRSIIMKMQRSPEQLKELDETDSLFMIAREGMQNWAARCNLKRDPKMPNGFRGRKADKWRPLISIADDLGYGDEARAVAVALESNRQYENPLVTLLVDSRTVFDAYGTDRLRTKSDLIPGLVGLPDSLWSEYAGLDGTGTPHMITSGDLGRLLGRLLGIRSQNLWPPERRPGDRSEKGYYRHQFESAWRSYCDPDSPETATPPDPDSTATPSQASKVRYLRKP
jgi:hypothetical protein